MNSVISTKPFLMIVEKSIRNDSAIEATQDMSALDEKIVIVEGMRRDVEELVDSMEATATKLDRIIDSHAYVKPVFMSEISGYVAQSMIVADHTVDGDIYLIGFSKDSDASKSLLMAYNAETNTILSSAEFPFGHANSMAIDSDGVIYLPNDDGKSVYRFTVTSFSGNLTINQLEPATIPTGWFCKDIFGHDGTVYANGTHEAKQYYWALGEEDTAVEIPLPDEMPRVSQSWSTDGRYLYVLHSSPNAVAVYDFASGEFIRWVDVGDYIGGTYPIGEMEALCITESGAMLLSQLYYDLPAKARRFWMISDLKLSSEIVSNQQHIYPNTERVIYVSNALGGNLTFRTNPVSENQTGSRVQPYPSLDSALYAAAATPTNKANIILQNTGTDYTIDNLILNMPSMDISISCAGNVLFQRLELQSGTLRITGNATFAQLLTTAGTKLRIDGGTFNAASRIADQAPYILDGSLSIVNSRYTGSGSNTVFEFKAGATGVVGFTEGSPVSTNYQQTNLVLLNVRNAGARERWTPIYSGGGWVTVGNDIPLTENIMNNAVYRVKWRTRDSHPYTTTLVSVNGNTRIELHFIIGSTSVVSRAAHLTFNSSTGNLRLEDMREYTWEDGGNLTILSAADGEFLEGWDIASVEVKGY